MHDLPEMCAGSATPSHVQSTTSNPHKPRSLFRRRFVDPFVSSKNPPWFDALGMAAGLFVGLGIPLGVQMLLLGLSRLCMRFNFAIAFACSCVNNPLSVIPLYYGYYCLGSRILGRQTTLDAAAFRAMLKPVTQADYFWESLHSFLYLGRDILLRWSLGAVLVASVVAVLGGVVCYNVQRIRHGRPNHGSSIASVIPDAVKGVPQAASRAQRYCNELGNSRKGEENLA